jgi:hypothetical protein
MANLTYELLGSQHLFSPGEIAVLNLTIGTRPHVALAETA